MPRNEDNHGALRDAVEPPDAPEAHATAPDAPEADAPTDEAAWAAGRMLRLLADIGESTRVHEGTELARLNRVVRLEVAPGRINASVRDRSTRPERVVIEAPTSPHEVWEGVIARAADAPSIAARFLAGAIPSEVESLMPQAPPGSAQHDDERQRHSPQACAALFPPAESLRASCRCADPEPWCRHACAALAALGARMREEPFLIFTLRGLPAEEVVERLRQRRAIQGRTVGEAPAYAQRPVIEGDAASRPLEMVADDFWDAGPELETLDTSLRRPEVSCALLRRLGPSPFDEAKFPLLGLLATCYEVISEHALRGEEEDDPPQEDAPPEGETPASD